MVLVCSVNAYRLLGVSRCVGTGPRASWCDSFDRLVLIDGSVTAWVPAYFLLITLNIASPFGAVVRFSFPSSVTRMQSSMRTPPTG